MKITVRHRKLRRHQAVGLAWGHMHGKKWVPSGKIEIDERETGQDHLDTTIHEVLHTLNPGWSEEEVIHQANVLAAVLWGVNYRRVQN